MDQSFLKHILALTAARNPNLPAHAQRMASLQFDAHLSRLDLEAAAAELAADSLRALAPHVKGARHV